MHSTDQRRWWSQMEHNGIGNKVEDTHQTQRILQQKKVCSTCVCLRGGSVVLVRVPECVRRFSQTAWGHLGQPGGGIQPVLVAVLLRRNTEPAKEEEEEELEKKKNDRKRFTHLVFFCIFSKGKLRKREKSRERRGLKMGGLCYKTKHKKRRRNTLLLLPIDGTVLWYKSKTRRMVENK